MVGKRSFSEWLEEEVFMWKVKEFEVMQRTVTAVGTVAKAGSAERVSVMETLHCLLARFSGESNTLFKDEYSHPMAYDRNYRQKA